MKKWAVFIGIAILLAAAAVVAYHLVNRPPSPDLPLNEQVAKIMEDGGCLMCHSENSEKPFYYDYPVIGPKLKKHVENGLRQEDLSEAFEALETGAPVSEATLAKIERAVTDGSMPIAAYAMVHWGSAINKSKRDIVLEWVAAHRAANYATGLAAPQFANEPVQPIPDSLPVDMRKVILGELLYHDPRLSVDNTVSCATCHDLETAGVDNEQVSEGVSGKLGGVNAPTVFNAAFNFVQFWDGRAATLAEQAAGPPLNPVEMASQSFDDIIAKLQKDRGFTQAFLEVYPEGYSEATITNAIEEFEKTLITPDSPFDRYLKGDPDAITADELAGYELFKKYECATCHVGVNLGGQSYEYMGLAHNYFMSQGRELTEEDYGRWKQTQRERDRHRFKVPGLRNVALTPPYYHDGSRATLEDAVRDMAKYQLGIELTQDETDKMVSFLNTLTGEYQGKPLTNKNL